MLIGSNKGTYLRVRTGRKKMGKFLLFLFSIVLVSGLLFFVGLENTLWAVGFLIVVTTVTLMLILTFPKESEFTFIRHGSTLSNIVGRIPGRKFKTDGEMEEVTPIQSNAPLEHNTWKAPNWFARLTWDYLRAYPVGIPILYQVHSFPILKKRLRSEALADQARPFQERWIEIEEKATMVFSLRWRFSRPVSAVAVELPKDSAKVTFVGEGLFEVINPSIPVFQLGGNFMNLVETIVGQGIVSACKMKYENKESKEAKKKDRMEQLSYRLLSGLDIGRQSLFVENIIKAVNDGEGENPGLIKQCGIKLVGLYIPDWEEDPGTAELVKAQQAFETAVAQGKGKVKDAQINAQVKVLGAQAEKAEKVLKGRGDAQAFAARLKVLTDAKVSPEDIATILAREGFSGQFLLESGAVKVASSVHLSGGPTQPPIIPNQQP